MTQIRRIKLVLPARMAGIAPAAAREIAERFVDGTHGTDLTQHSLTLTDTGQTPGQIGLAAAQAATRIKSGGQT